MATPHVTGLVALILGDDNSLEPSEIRSQLIANAHSDQLTDVSSDTSNLLVSSPFVDTAVDTESPRDIDTSGGSLARSELFSTAAFLLATLYLMAMW